MIFGDSIYSTGFDKSLEVNLEWGGGLTYIHAIPGRATHVLRSIERFQEICGGFDPGHKDDFEHTHFYVEDQMRLR